MNCLVVGKGGLPSSRNGARMVPCRLPDASHCARSSRSAGCKRQACRQSLSWRGFAAFRIPACHATITASPSTGELFSPIFGQASFPEIILTNTKHFSSTSLRTVRSQLRCDPDARRDTAHKTFIYRRRRHLPRESARQCHMAASLHRICEFGEANGDAPV